MIFGIREKVSVEGTAIFPGGDIRDLLALKMPLKVTGIRDLGGPSLRMIKATTQMHRSPTQFPPIFKSTVFEAVKTSDAC